MLKSFLLIAISFLLFATNYSQKIIKKDVPTKVIKKSKRLSQQSIYERPKKIVNDYEQLLTLFQVKNLDSTIRAFEKETGVEIAIVSIGNDNATSDNFDSTILKIHNKWGVGKFKLNNGIVIGISSELKKIRISNGEGIREKLTDEKTKIIIEEKMIPEFKEKKYYLGLLKGLIEIISTQR
jgi:uncharacterized protein